MWKNLGDVVSIREGEMHVQLEDEPAFAWRKDEGQREGILRKVQVIDTATKHRDVGKEFPEVLSGLRVVSPLHFLFIPQYLLSFFNMLPFLYSVQIVILVLTFVIFKTNILSMFFDF